MLPVSDPLILVDIDLRCSLALLVLARHLRIDPPMVVLNQVSPVCFISV